MAVVVDVQYACNDSNLPDAQTIHGWVGAALEGRRADAELTVRIVDDKEGAALNSRWRGGSGPTNVLSFPFEQPPGLELNLLGDIVVCAPVAQREAVERGIPAQAHWAHLVVHGVLHLLGFDHMQTQEAEEMEQQEVNILGMLGYPDPYKDHAANG